MRWDVELDGALVLDLVRRNRERRNGACVSAVSAVSTSPSDFGRTFLEPKKLVTHSVISSAKFFRVGAKVFGEFVWHVHKGVGYH